MSTTELPPPLPVRRLKRALDLLFVLGFVALAWPLLLALLLAMWIDMLLHPESRGPLLYHETRISRGREFRMYKLRSVKQSVIDAARNSPEGLVTLKHLEKDEANFTAVGSFLRKFYLDELGQLVNILTGDMTIVGPRPWPPKEFWDSIAQVAATKGRMPCGLCGPVQAGKGTTGLAYHTVEAEYTEVYATASTLTLLRTDIHFMYRTLRTLLRGEGL